MADENEKKPEALPETVFIKWEVDGDSSYLLAYEDQGDAFADNEDVVEVGVYKLERVKKLRRVIEEV